MSELKTFLTVRRENLGINKSTLACRLKTSRSNITRWESGATQPNVQYLIKLADLYDISLDELVGRRRQNAL